MQMRLAAQANVEEKRIAELKARLKENLSLLDRERTCRELTRMQGELIKTSLGTAHVRQSREFPLRMIKDIIIHIVGRMRRKGTFRPYQTP